LAFPTFFATEFATRYVTRKAGVITRYVTPLIDKDESGNPVTKYVVVRSVTTYLEEVAPKGGEGVATSYVVKASSKAPPVEEVAKRIKALTGR